MHWSASAALPFYIVHIVCCSGLCWCNWCTVCQKKNCAKLICAVTLLIFHWFSSFFTCWIKNDLRTVLPKHFHVVVSYCWVYLTLSPISLCGLGFTTIFHFASILLSITLAQLLMYYHLLIFFVKSSFVQIKIYSIDELKQQLVKMLMNTVLTFNLEAASNEHTHNRFMALFPGPPG